MKDLLTHVSGLGMTDITFWPSDRQWPRVATVYAGGPKGLTKSRMPNDTMSRNIYFRGSGAAAN